MHISLSLQIFNFSYEVLLFCTFDILELNARMLRQVCKD